MIHDRSDPETLAERANTIHATKQFEERLFQVMRKHRMRPLDYRTAK
jgi:hypothetical protein